MTHTVRNAAEARRLLASAQDPRNVNALSPGERAPQRMKYDRTVDLQVADVPGVSVNVSEFNAALKAIQDLCDEFMQNAQHAAGLTTRLHDGFGPVAEAVGNAFEHRLSSSGGAPYAISTGSGLFDQIASTLQGIITGYQQGEDAAFGAISQAGQGQ